MWRHGVPHESALKLVLNLAADGPRWSHTQTAAHGFLTLFFPLTDFGQVHPHSSFCPFWKRRGAIPKQASLTAQNQTLPSGSCLWLCLFAFFYGVKLSCLIELRFLPEPLFPSLSTLLLFSALHLSHTRSAFREGNIPTRLQWMHSHTTLNFTPRWHGSLTTHTRQHGHYYY